MTFTDTALAVGVIIGVFILAYSAIRHKDLLDVVQEIKEIITGKAADAAEVGGLKYA